MPEPLCLALRAEVPAGFIEPLKGGVGLRTNADDGAENEGPGGRTVHCGQERGTGWGERGVGVGGEEATK